MSGHWTF